MSPGAGLVALLDKAAMTESVAGRAYPRAYRTSGKRNIWDFIISAVVQSGGTMVSATTHLRAPIYVTSDSANGERVGMLVYPFRASTILTRNRPTDEAKLQIRYGDKPSWDAETHPLGWDPAKVDITMVLGCHLDMGVFIGLDPATYDPLPMGISVELKVGQLDAARESGWHVMTRTNVPGSRRTERRAEEGDETIVLFRPERLLDYARLDRRAADLGLDPPLRFAAAEGLAVPAGGDAVTLHRLERQFGLSSNEILDIISGRNRLAVAVRGGVAEHHLEKVLRTDPTIIDVRRLDLDSMHDFDVRLRDGRTLRVECKNASPDRYADGDEKVEVQKTRMSAGDAASRFYSPDQFEVVAACLFATRGEWTFRFQSTAKMARHPRFPDRLATNHHVDSGWTDSPSTC